MGAVAGRAICQTSDVVVSFLDDWSIATTGTDATDIANLADADCELANPQIVYWINTPGGGAYDAFSATPVYVRGLTWSR